MPRVQWKLMKRLSSLVPGGHAARKTRAPVGEVDAKKGFLHISVPFLLHVLPTTAAHPQGGVPPSPSPTMHGHQAIAPVGGASASSSPHRSSLLSQGAGVSPTTRCHFYFPLLFFLKWAHGLPRSPSPSPLRPLRWPVARPAWSWSLRRPSHRPRCTSGCRRSPTASRPNRRFTYRRQFLPQSVMAHAFSRMAYSGIN